MSETSYEEVILSESSYVPIIERCAARFMTGDSQAKIKAAYELIEALQKDIGSKTQLKAGLNPSRSLPEETYCAFVMDIGFGTETHPYGPLMGHGRTLEEALLNYLKYLLHPEQGAFQTTGITPRTAWLAVGTPHGSKRSVKLTPERDLFSRQDLRLT
jgi:hypothetical protein